MPARSCNANAKSGKPCKATPLKGKNFCAAHDPETPASARFGSRAQATEAGKLGGRPKAPRVVDVLKERMEAEIDTWLGALKDALHAEMPFSVGWGEDAEMEMVPDHRTRLAAFKEACDRAYGKAKQQTEITGADGGPIEMVPVARDRGDQVARILGGTRAVPVIIANGNGNGHPSSN